MKLMRMLLLVILFLFTTIGYSITSGNAVSLQWDANTETDLAGYKIYYGTNSGVYFVSVDVGNTTTTTVGNLTPGVTYYFAATAYNVSRLESDRSNEVSYTVPLPTKPLPVTNLNVTY